ncbi:putative prefoldin subunit 6 [Erysiphe neolycopersici]|uniref:Putative prefoldin subunit 6 n=1 Tax=Erysiphe neolycopersici TaxID=212602 RepID=A0A420I3X4_9PEZI|nr:putative prefoldin subunit 6 [Erysiphe neolycopersici]
MANAQPTETLSQDYQSLQQDLQTNIQSRQTLESQLQENKGVQMVEFANLADDNANIYKLVGPVLLKQDKAEAVLAVDARLEFINNEIMSFFSNCLPRKRVEEKIKELRSKSDAIRVQDDNEVELSFNV